jgi:hypothetical protein
MHGRAFMNQDLRRHSPKRLMPQEIARCVTSNVIFESVNAKKTASEKNDGIFRMLDRPVAMFEQASNDLRLSHE